MFLWPSKPIQIQDPDSMVGDLVKSPNWVVQLKKNGCRAIVSGENDQVTIYERHGTILSVSMEHDWSPLLKLFKQPFVLDGELIGRKQGEISNRLYLWDIPVEGGVDMTTLSYEDRYRILMSNTRLLSGLPKKDCPLGVERILMNDLLEQDLRLRTPFTPPGIYVFIAKNYVVTDWQDVMRWALRPAVEAHLLAKAKQRNPSRLPGSLINDIPLDETFAKELRTGEQEGLVFKNIKHSMSWDRSKTREVPQQLKFLFKFANKRKSQIFSDIRKEIWQDLNF